MSDDLSRARKRKTIEQAKADLIALGGWFGGSSKERAVIDAGILLLMEYHRSLLSTPADVEERGRLKGLEEAAKWHEVQMGSAQRRLDAANLRKAFDGMSGAVGNAAFEISGNHVTELREALRDEIATHEIAATGIRALAGKTEKEPTP